MSAPLTPDAALARLRQYGERTSAWSTATYNDGTEKALHEIALTLAAEMQQLRDRVAELETQSTCLSQMTTSLGTSTCALPARHRGDHRNAAKNHYWSDEYAAGVAEPEAMREQHPAPRRVPDSPDCACPAETDAATQ
ncbi:hypothetical protein OH809_45325 (plasmid) [Streptomyces sp. NBC_00873]|uniref:hypothetical protein n=1 Tax=Streptomyces sp. NBC_00873 TaxID=2975852 RepID=UPI0037DDDE50|nr:hypothetical protein OH809_45325 [Streptomyces sp. NBC_00873]